jgi:hypothetical protein
MYCSAHACTFALRRGATVDEVAAALESESALSEADRAAVRVARGLSVVPAALDGEARADLRRHFSETDAEWIVLAIATMGWLNKTMDALGVPLEEGTVAEVSSVLARSGWTTGKHGRGTVVEPGTPPIPDSLRTRLSLLRHAPKAIQLDKAWTEGVPDRWPAAGDYLQQKAGHSFPVLSCLRHPRAIRAIATMIALNLDRSPDSSVIGHKNKLAAGLIYAETVGNSRLTEDLRALGAEALPDSPDSPTQQLARAISPSPARVDERVLEAVRAEIPPAGIIELVSFLAVLQMLHRLQTFYPDAA